MAERKNCPYSRNGEHKFFVADTIGVPNRGIVAMVGLCTACGEPFCDRFRVAEPGDKLVLASDERKEKQ